MSKTQQGSFDTTYHHIEAPTVQDDEWGRIHKSRRLVIPTEEQGDPTIFRDPLLFQLANTDWQYKRKLDGANLRVRWDGEQALWNGKSNAFTCGADLTDYMNATFIEEIFEEKFGRDKTVILFGEQMGKKVQTNELGLNKVEFVLFDVNINGYWLSPENVREIATYFKVRTCYDFMPDAVAFSDTLTSLIQRVARGDFSEWEGVVATPVIECRNQRGDRTIVKIKNRDYLRNE